MPVRAPDVAHSATGRCFISRTATGREATCIFRSTCNIYIHIVLILLLEIRDLYIIYLFFLLFQLLQSCVSVRFSPPSLSESVSLEAWWRMMILTYTSLLVKIYFIHARSRLISKNADRSPYGARPGIGRWNHNYTDAGRRPYDLWPRMEKIMKIVRCPGDSQIRRWFSNRKIERRQFQLWPY